MKHHGQKIEEPLRKRTRINLLLLSTPEPSNLFTDSAKPCGLGIRRSRRAKDCERSADEATKALYAHLRGPWLDRGAELGGVRRA